MALGATLSKSLSSLAAARHGCKVGMRVIEVFMQVPPVVISVCKKVEAKGVHMQSWAFEYHCTLL